MKIDASELMEAPKWQSRMELPGILNDLGLLGIGVEIGVQRGIFSSHIRANWDGELIHCVDPWAPYSGVLDSAEQHLSYMADAKMHLASTGKPFKIHQMTAMEFAKGLPPGTQFDFLFLDGNHDYAPVVEELEVFWPLVKPGGILAGHDYQPINGWIVDERPFEAYETEAEALKNGHHCGPFHVKRAVDEFFGNMTSITSPDEDRGWMSWAVRKALK